jgi:hypothetical protein
MQLQAIMTDNASNNDSMMDRLAVMLSFSATSTHYSCSLESRFMRENISFSAAQARMRCPPHIVHLAAVKVIVVSLSTLICHSLV